LLRCSQLLHDLSLPPVVFQRQLDALPLCCMFALASLIFLALVLQQDSRTASSAHNMIVEFEQTSRSIDATMAHCQFGREGRSRQGGKHIIIDVPGRKTPALMPTIGPR
jgi:hypothetical protein